MLTCGAVLLARVGLIDLVALALVAALLVVALLLAIPLLHTAQGRRKATDWLRAAVADDEPWSSAAVLVALIVSLVLGLFAARWPSVAKITAFIAAAAVVLWGVASRFSRRTLRTVTLTLLTLGAIGVLALGRQQVRSEARDSADRAADRLSAQLDELEASLPSPDTARAETRAAIEDLQDRVPRGRRHDVRAALSDRLIDLQAALDLTARADVAANVEADLNMLARRVRSSDLATRQLVNEAIALATHVRTAPPTAVPKPISTARESVVSIRRAVNGRASPKELDTTVAKGRLETARAVADRRPSDDAATAVGTAEARYLAAVEKEPVHTSLTDGFSAGGRALVADFPGLKGSQVPFSLATTGWVLLAALAIVLYRRLESRTGRGELLLNKVEKAGDDDGTTTFERFRTYLTRNIPEPSAVPAASSALTPVTDLLTAVSATPATWIGTVFSAAASALKAPRGAAVTVSVLEVGTGEKAPDKAKTGENAPDKPSAAAAQEPASVVAGASGVENRAQVAVRVSPPGAGEQLQRTFDANTLDEALRIGAYWAAAVLIERSRRTPAWAAWNAEACHALATYYAEADRPGQERPPLEKMQEAVAIDPRSGLLLIELANRYALEERLVDSFELCLRAASLYRRWPVANYRLAATATMLASHGAWQWRQAEEHIQEVICVALDRAPLPGSMALAEGLRTKDPDTQRRALCTFAGLVLDKTCQHIAYGQLWRGLLRTNERAYWFTVLRARQHVTFRTQFRLLADSAATMAAIRAVPGQDVPSELNNAVKQEGLTWQLAYNLACIHSQRALQPSLQLDAQDREIALALGLLELAVSRPGGHQLTSDWLQKDPDLVPLHGEARFERLAASLPSEESER